MEQIQLAIRLIIIKEDKVLLINNMRDNFYYFIGGKVNYGESLKEAAQRELREETGFPDLEYNFIKPLYLQEIVKPVKSKHKVELFVLGDINYFEELEGKHDPEHDGSDYLTWIPLESLPEHLLPIFIKERLRSDYQTNFRNINVPTFSDIEK